ncbi:hypothetical protein [Leptospira adleri]|uniref:Uncharacterized protein n=1 Tax=Leptospira adleri TaxID=2023186 RepID=A0A2M9YJ40_9LEPT|nr:hypothetical protein [Leptospira adleri]PJZ51561.1 hypothetical protein CH380_19115 [Leptospira adleri]PJZ61930.1 hypothetical protein CH376_11050 [Leptospira adleri]
MNPDIRQRIQFNQSEILKSEVLLTSSERIGLNLITGSNPFFARESDTGRILFWDGCRWVDVLSDPGFLGVNILRLASNVSDGETISIGGLTFQFDRAAAGVPAGRIGITSHSDDTPVNVSTSIVAAINSQNRSEVLAMKMSNNEILTINKDFESNPSFGSTMAGANNQWASPNSIVGEKPGTVQSGFVKRIPTAVEVALGKIRVVFDFPPTLLEIRVVLSAKPGVQVAWDGTVSVSGNILTLDNASGSTPFLATHTITLWVGKSA